MTRRRRLALALSGLLLVLLVAAWLGVYRPTRAAVGIGAGYLAKQLCSCVHVAGRPLPDCRADQFATTDPIRVELLREPRRVRAWVPLLGERTALYREGLGCMLE